MTVTPVTGNLKRKATVVKKEDTVSGIDEEDEEDRRKEAELEVSHCLNFA